MMRHLAPIALALVAMTALAHAQDTAPAAPGGTGAAAPTSATDPADTGSPAPGVPSAPTVTTPTLTAPPAVTAAPPAVGAPAAQAMTGNLFLSAVFAGEAKPIRSGLTWRIFEERPDGQTPVMIRKSDAPTPSFSVPPGTYIVHASYGYASASARATVTAGSVIERLPVSAGALRLHGAIGEQPLPPRTLSFSVFVPIGNNLEGRLVTGSVKAGELVRLPEGVYHVVSTYGDSNAIMRADLRVETGRITEATLNHRAATVTLKLVASAGGEAFAGTAFSVLTPGGDVIREAIGAFPSVTLAEGDYVLIARHDGKVYTREFKVESGLDRDIEILTQN